MHSDLEIAVLISKPFFFLLFIINFNQKMYLVAMLKVEIA